VNDPKRNGAWLLILLAGAPVYFVWRRRWSPGNGCQTGALESSHR
jgi:hypothetical protein